MAELTEPTAQTTSPCCAPEAQQTCCEPSEKASCCDSAAGGGSCGCAAGQSADANTLRDTVRERYAAAALAASGERPSSCCGADAAVIADSQVEQFGAALYEDNDRSALPDTAVLASLGCGNPTAVAELREGETVLDLGSGAGGDVLLSAKRVGPSGRAYGLDMTDEMLELARRNAREAGPEERRVPQGRDRSGAAARRVG